jgi:hypothetical protein
MATASAVFRIGLRIIIFLLLLIGMPGSGAGNLDFGRGGLQAGLPLYYFSQC